MIHDPVSDFHGQVHSAPGLCGLNDIRHAEALDVMLKPARMNFVQDFFPVMAKRRVSEVMPQCDCLRQVLIEIQCPCNGSCNLRNLNGMREPCPEMVALRCQEYLCLMHESSERLGMDNPVPVSLKIRPYIAFFLGKHSSFGFSTFGCFFRQNLKFAFFQFFSK